MSIANQYERVHFISIGGSVMHNLALALAKSGCTITGSDDEIYEPSRTRLANAGLLPAQMGWIPSNIDKNLDAVIVGMHAKADNPELRAAKEQGIPVFSFPDFVTAQSKNKQRIIIAGSHGKTTITSMILHVLQYVGKKFDYLVGSQLAGFDHMVQLSDAPIIVIEGDEYPTSPEDSDPKFFKYHHHLCLISGIAWDHYNKYPDFDNYQEQFFKLIDMTPKSGTVIYNGADPIITKHLKDREHEDIQFLPYSTLRAKIKDGVTLVESPSGWVSLKVFGNHNLENLAGAFEILRKLAVTENQFFEAIQSFNGAAKRLELLAKNEESIIYRDFAHAPSKVKASTAATKNQFETRTLVACLELHTFSSLNQDFLPQYAGALSTADVPVVYFNPHTLKHKGLPMLTKEQVRNAFGDSNLTVFDDSKELAQFLLNQSWKKSNLLLMSSGNFDNLDLDEISQHILK